MTLPRPSGQRERASVDGEVFGDHLPSALLPGCPLGEGLGRSRSYVLTPLIDFRSTGGLLSRGRGRVDRHTEPIGVVREPVRQRTFLSLVSEEESSGDEGGIGRAHRLYRSCALVEGQAVLNLAVRPVPPQAWVRFRPVTLDDDQAHGSKRYRVDHTRPLEVDRVEPIG